MIDFNKSTLFISARSPFARRVRIAFIEHDVIYEEKVVDVFNPPKELEIVNPLLRVPALKLSNESVIVDSNAILNLFYSQNDKSPLLPWTEEDLVKQTASSGLAMGICELAVRWHIEGMRPESVRDGDARTEYESNVKRAVKKLAEYLGVGEYFSATFSQSDIDVGTALEYLRLRMPWDWGREFSNLQAYLSRLSQRPSFKATVPPAA
jgi:glutathione S-transferase